MNLLSVSLTGVLAGRGGLTLIGGEADIGETTLAEALLAEAVAQGAQGLPNAQAAERLFLSPRTTDQHLRYIFTTLEVDNSAATTAFAIDYGLR